MAVIHHFSVDPQLRHPELVMAFVPPLSNRIDTNTGLETWLNNPAVSSPRPMAIFAI